MGRRRGKIIILIQLGQGVFRQIGQKEGFSLGHGTTSGQHNYLKLQ